jgi:hypothetical protein
VYSYGVDQVSWRGVAAVEPREPAG